jgi:formyl-CoA transferase/CoA:oxalate CoA-transferase
VFGHRRILLPDDFPVSRETQFFAPQNAVKASAMRPLDDLLVLDLSRILSGPYCSMYLGDFGARVVKVEHPQGGDDTRGFGPPFMGPDDAQESTYFLSVNRNKESVAIDLKTDEGRALVRRLADKADILVENFRPGALDRLGLSYESLRASNPRLIYASISGFGHAGDPTWVRKPGYDVVIQGMGGLQSLTGASDGPPFKVGTSIADMVSGMYALIGILAALHARHRTGRGQHVDVSMLDGQISLLTYHASAHLNAGARPTRKGNAHPSIAPYETFAAQDGHFNLAVGNDALWRAFAQAVGEPLSTLVDDPRFATNAARVKHRDELLAVLLPLFAERTVDAWLTLCDRAGVPAGPILSVEQALAHPQVHARAMVTEVEHSGVGAVRMTGVPVRLSETPASVRTAPPRLGEHTERVLGELLDLPQAELSRLRSAGVFGR